jgi:hypothetical protein
MVRLINGTPPDIVAEMYSPGQEDRRDLVLKAAWYVEQGVQALNCFQRTRYPID